MNESEALAEAERVLEFIGDHIAIAHPARAISFLRELRSNCLGLAVLPNGVPLVRRYEQSDTRRRLHGNYLICYRPEAERIVALHVLLGRENHTQILLAEGEDLS